MIFNTYYKSLLVLTTLLVMFISCTKQNSPTQNDKEGIVAVKINRTYHSQTPLVSDSEFVIVQDLFQKNNLSLSNLQVYRLQTDNLDRHHVRCYQFYGNLEYFTNEVIFHFNNQDIYYFLSGDLITNISLDTIPKVTATDAGTLFYGEIASDSWYKDSLSSFQRQGLDAELGIYDLNAGISYTPTNFVLAWKMTVANGRDYPVGYVRADSLSLIYYFNGVIIN